MPQDVPEPFKESLEVLGRLSDEQVKDALNTLESEPYIRSRKAVRQALQTAVADDAMSSTLGELSAMLLAFARLSHTRGERAVKRMFDEFSTGSNLALTDEQRAGLAGRLLAFVVIPGMVWAARAGHVERNHERLLTEAGIETDLRPLMDEDGKVAMMIPWHTLNLRYTSRQFDEDQSESIVLDNEDLISLRSQIDDALEVTLGLQKDLQQRNINVWEPYIPEQQQEFQSTMEEG